MNAKTVNYTAEMTAELVSAYVANPTADTVSEFAVKFGRSVKSIVAKLSKEQVYVKAVRVTKTGDAVVKKEELADMLSARFGLTDSEADSLTKANKTALRKMVAVYDAIMVANEVQKAQADAEAEAAGSAEFAENVADAVGTAADEASDAGLI